MKATVIGRTPSLPPQYAQLAMVIGFGAVGGSAFVMLAAGPRVLGTSGYTSLALVWTAFSIIGIGVAAPGEQVITRSVASGGGDGVVRVVGRRLAVAAPVCLGLVPFLGSDDDGGAAAGWVWGLSLLLSTASLMFASVQRGALAGQGLFAAYAFCLCVEAAVRVVVVAAALLLPSAGLVLLAASVCLPPVVSGLLAWAYVRRNPLGRVPSMAEDTRLEHLSMTSMALLLQACLSTGQLWLNAQSPDPALAGAFVTAASYMRIPTIFANGLYSPLLMSASTAFAQGRKRVVLRRTSEAIVLGAGGAALAVAVMLALRPLAMQILYGADPGLDAATYEWLGLATVGIIAASIMTNALYGCERAGLACVLWIPPAALTTLLFSRANGDATAMAVATAVGQVLALMLLLAAFLYVLRVAPARRG